MSSRTIRVATWNVHGLRGGVSAVASRIHEQQPDLVLIQESGPRRRLRELCAVLGWQTPADPRAFPRRRIQNAILTRPAAVSVVRSWLVRFSPTSPIHPRGAMAAEIDERLFALSVHLGLHGAERGRHVAALLALGPMDRAVIGADLNARPDDPGPRTMAERLTDVWAAVGEDDGATFPAHAPAVRIDYLFAGPAVQPLRAWTAGGIASDHLMVVADLCLGVSDEGEASARGSGRTGLP